VAVLGGDSDIGGGRRQSLLSVVFVIAALGLGALSQDAQQRVAGALRASVLRPFLALQEGLTLARTRAGDVDELMLRVDSLSAILTAQSVLVEENRTLRRLLALGERLGPRFRAATAVRPGTPGSESILLLDLGLRDGVDVGAPVISPDGLVGVVRDAGAATSVAMDWTHPDFRASAMALGTEMYGIVENRRGSFREEDRLVLTGTAYNESVPDGTPVVTSGLGVYPRGIPIGTIDGVADYEGSWRKSYWLRPSVLPASVTHVLVPVGTPTEDGIAWPEPAIGPGLEDAGDSVGRPVDPAPDTAGPAADSVPGVVPPPPGGPDGGG
jgi:rod shape-determining protein MreC